MPETKPVLSIVTPCFNAVATIQQLVDSVQSSIPGRVEHIVMDAGSTDGTRELLLEAESVTCVFEPDDGPYDAVNKGFARARGTIFAWMNADDFFIPGALDLVITLFETFPEIEWISSLYPLFASEDGSIVSSRRIEGFCRERALYPVEQRFRQGNAVHSVLQQESTFWRRSLWDKSGGLNTTYSLAADIDLWLRFWNHAELVGVTTPLGCFRWSDAQRSYASRDAYENQVDEILIEHGGRTVGRMTALARSASLLLRGMPQSILCYSGCATRTPMLTYDRSTQSWHLTERFAVLP